ncbi:MAG: acyl-CoA carboxylase subunit beta, partial [Dehalococcoidia bacterium]|nr:acyl-CoA carboxylase subunit beta [Dehalococcoidia bacterium]
MTSDHNRIRQEALLGGGAEKMLRQHESGKLTARERIAGLLDEGSFSELDMLARCEERVPGDGIVSGYGTIDGRTVCIFAQDATVRGGSAGVLHARKMYKATENALNMGVPIIGLYDSPGGRAAKAGDAGEQSVSRSCDEKSSAGVFFINTQASGVVPQISAMLGTCAGHSVYSASLTDFIYVVDGISHMFVTGPRILKMVMSEDISKEDLGGARVHSRKSGVADFRVPSEEECFRSIKKLLGYLPSNNGQSPPMAKAAEDPDRLDDAIAEIMPSNRRKPYDVRRLIARLADAQDFFEVKAEFAPEMVVGFGRLNGQPVGFIANQPMVRAGSLTSNSSVKEARFIRFCDSFNMPIITLVDTPAYMPGSEQEHAGIIRHGGKVIHAFCEATVPRIAVVLRKAYGGGSLGMGIACGMGSDMVFAWPTAEWGIMGAEETVALFHAAEVAAAENPEQFKALKIAEYERMYG